MFARRGGGRDRVACVAILVLGVVRPSAGGTYEDLVRLADGVLALRPHPERWDWNWGEAVLSYGLLGAYSVTGDSRYQQHVQQFLDAHIDDEGGLDIAFVYPDRVAPALPTFGMFKITGDERYAAVCDRMADWLLYDAPRARDGGWFHLPVLDWQYVDTLFMTTVFLAAYGRYTGRDDYVEEALRQHQLLAGNLYSPDARLYWHGWDQNGLFCPWATPFRHHNEAFWGRGNGWAVLSAELVLERADPTSPDFEPVRVRLEETLMQLAEWQDAASGHWWTVIDRPGAPFNYTETTATALITDAWGRAVEAALIEGDPPAGPLSAGLAAVQDRIREDEAGRAHLVGASVGTNPSGYWGYVLTPTLPDRPWGTGAALALLADAVRFGWVAE